jgi:hypothetical protein
MEFRQLIGVEDAFASRSGLRPTTVRPQIVTELRLIASEAAAAVSINAAGPHFYPLIPIAASCAGPRISSRSPAYNSIIRPNQWPATFTRA